MAIEPNKPAAAAKPLPKVAWDACNAAAKTSGLEPALIRAVCWVESRGDPTRVSPVGAQGLMQLMPATARMLGVHDAFDAKQNAAGGAHYLAELVVRYGAIDEALYAYNWGPGNIDLVRAGKKHLPDSVRAYAAMVQAREERERTFTGPLVATPPAPPAAATVPRLRGLQPRSSDSSNSDDGDKSK